VSPTPEPPDDDLNAPAGGPRTGADGARPRPLDTGPRKEAGASAAAASEAAAPREAAQAYETGPLARENAELRRLLAEAGRLAEFGRYAAKLNHELRQPLFAIRGLAQLLLDKNEALDPEETREFARSIVEQADRLGHLVTQLRALSLPPRWSGDHAAPTADVAEAVKKVMDFLAARLKKALTLSVKVDTPLPRATITEDALQQILINLLINALDAVETGGAIQLRARQIAWPEEALDGKHPREEAARSEGKREANLEARPAIEIAVGDDGAGIDPQARAHLFEPFYSTKPPGAGTGLGLVVSRDLARAAGGELAADFSPHAASNRFVTPAKTVFVLTLPAARSSDDDGRAPT